MMGNTNWYRYLLGQYESVNSNIVKRCRAFIIQKLGKKWEVPVHGKKGKIVDFSKEAKCCLTGWVIMLYSYIKYLSFKNLHFEICLF